MDTNKVQTNLQANDEVISVSSRDFDKTSTCCDHHIWTERLVKDTYRAQDFLQGADNDIMLKSKEAVRRCS